MGSLPQSRKTLRTLQAFALRIPRLRFGVLLPRAVQNHNPLLTLFATFGGMTRELNPSAEALPKAPSVPAASENQQPPQGSPTPKDHDLGPNEQGVGPTKSRGSPIQ